MCDETIDADADAKSNDKAKLYDAKLSPKDNEKNSNEKKVTCKTQNFLYFTCIFINYYSIIDSC